jgi:hypothetical protein
MGSIRGFINDTFGKPVENATIAMPQIGYFALSHQDGSFIIDDIPNGVYTVHVIQRYYKPFIFRFDVYSDMMANGIVLEPVGGDPVQEMYIGGERAKVSALEAKKEIEDTLLQIPGVAGVGIDRAFKVIQVYTTNCEEKLLKQLPIEIAGFGVTVLCTGNIKALAEMPAPSPSPSNGYPPRAEYRVRRYRPAIGGISAAHEAVRAGTLGAVVRNAEGKKMLLSNTHVFANRDMTNDKRADFGDHILQPGEYDTPRLMAMGVTDNTIGYLRDWMKLDPNNDNLIDAAIAEPINQDAATEFILANDANQLIRVKGTKSVTQPMLVKKYSRTTDVAEGKIVDWDASVIVTYQGIPCKFVDQIIIEMDATPGDSGSLILDMDNNAVGLLFGGAIQNDKNGVPRQFVFANKISNIAAMMGIRFGNETDIPPPWSTGIIN